MTILSLHPSIDNGIAKGNASFNGGKIHCLCKVNPVEATISSNVAYNHACGCTKCWKPKNAIFSVVGVVPRDKLEITKNVEKLSVVDTAAAIQRHACKECGVHIYGRIENKQHPLYGFDFIHTELSDEKGWEEPRFAAFVSSVIEGGTPPIEMAGIRQRLSQIGLPYYDCLSPDLMDVIATHTAKAKGVLK